MIMENKDITKYLEGLKKFWVIINKSMTEVKKIKNKKKLLELVNDTNKKLLELDGLYFKDVSSLMALNIMLGNQNSLDMLTKTEIHLYEEVSKIVNLKREWDNLSSEIINERIKSLPNIFDLEDDIKTNPYLQNNILHKYLQNNPLYSLFYKLWRLEFRGLYESIPLHFVVFAYNIFRYKYKLKVANNVKLYPLSLLTIAPSSSGKSVRAEFMLDLFNYCLNEKNYILNIPTPQKIRGSVELLERNKDEKIRRFIVIPGAINSPLIVMDEMKTLMRRINMDPTLGDMLLKILENGEIEGDTMKSVQVAKMIVEWKKKYETAVENDDEEEQTELRKYEDIMRLNTNVYKIVYNDEKEQYKIIFKNHSAMLLYSQPIISSNLPTEKTSQISFGYNSGFYNRFLFMFEKDITQSMRNIYYEEQEKYINNLKEQYTIKDLSINVLKDKIKQDLKQRIEDMPEKVFNFDTIAPKREQKYLKKLSKYIRDILNESHYSYRKDVISNYINRLTGQLTNPVLLLLLYLSGENEERQIEINTISWLINYLSESFLQYFELVNETQKNRYIISEDDYRVILIKYLINEIRKKQTYNEKDWITYKTCYDKCKTLIRVKFGEFRKTLWNNLIQNLVQNKVVLVTNHNPITDQNFERNTKKILFVKDNTLMTEPKLILEELFKIEKW